MELIKAELAGLVGGRCFSLYCGWDSVWRGGCNL